MSWGESQDDFGKSYRYVLLLPDLLLETNNYDECDQINRVDRDCYYFQIRGIAIFKRMKATGPSLFLKGFVHKYGSKFKLVR